MDEKDYERLQILPIHLACKEGNYDEVVRLIKEDSLNEEAETVYGIRPIHEAVLGNHFKIVQYLVETCKVDISTEDDFDERTLLHMASMNGNIDIIRYLLSFNEINPHRDYYGYYASDYFRKWVRKQETLRDEDIYDLLNRKF
jgi:ankyrin repeat protein